MNKNSESEGLEHQKNHRNQQNTAEIAANELSGSMRNMTFKEFRQSRNQRSHTNDSNQKPTSDLQKMLALNLDKVNKSNNRDDFQMQQSSFEKKSPTDISVPLDND